MAAAGASIRCPSDGVSLPYIDTLMSDDYSAAP